VLEQDVEKWQHAHLLNGPLSGYQKGKTELDFTEARDSEWQWHQLGHTHLGPDRWLSHRYVERQVGQCGS